MRIILISLVLIIAVNCSLIAQQPPNFSLPPILQNWWKDPEIIKELQLSEAQAAYMETNVGGRQREQTQMTAEFISRQDNLKKLLDGDPLNEDAIQKQIELVAESSSAMAKARSSMQLLIRKNLTKEQWVKLNSRSMPTPAMTYNPIGAFNPSVIKTPKIINRTLPSYTAAARANRIEGLILLQAVVHKDGTATVTKVLQGLGYGLDQQAIDVVNKYWRFEPGTRDGAPVEVPANIEVHFRLH